MDRVGERAPARDKYFQTQLFEESHFNLPHFSFAIYKMSIQTYKNAPEQRTLFIIKNKQILLTMTSDIS